MSGEEANHDDLLAQFQVCRLIFENSNTITVIVYWQAISGADLERSRFYLESANWKLDLAISAFYEDPEANEAGAGGGAEAPKTGDQAASADGEWKRKIQILDGLTTSSRSFSSKQAQVRQRLCFLQD